MHHCQNCGHRCESQIQTFLHIFTCHLHQDIGLEAYVSRVILAGFSVYHFGDTETVPSEN